MKLFLIKLYRLIDHKATGWMNALRLLRLKMLGADIGKGVRVFGRFYFVGNGSNLKIGDGCTINEGVILNARDRLTIGNHVHMSPNVQIHTGQLQIQSGHKVHECSPVTIEEHAWLASGVIVVAGVTVGAHSIVAAGAVVSSDIPSQKMAGGIPAKILKDLQ